jgi:hypothetical protein
MTDKTSGRIGWLGFDGRVFLTKEEHDAYCRRLPVRYAARNLKIISGICSVCGKPATPDNPLQAAHLIPFGAGIIQFWLTPEWLDGPENLTWAHRVKCNKLAEIPINRIAGYLKQKIQYRVSGYLTDRRHHRHRGAGNSRCST